jgi:hypothetical protein
MCVGKEWIEKYKNTINDFSKHNKLHILTDSENEFKDCVKEKYTRDVFSYYEKINFIFKLSKKYKERIYYIDVDWLGSYDTNIKVDDNSLYTYTNFLLNEKNVVTDFFTEKEWKIKETILSKIGVNGELKDYIAEALIFFPYNKNINEIISDSKILQEYLEKEYNEFSVTSKRLDRYKKGIGYGEGFGLTALATKYKIPIKQIDWRKKTIL